MNRFTFDTAIERDDHEFELRVVYSATPFYPATYWQPAEGGECELISMKCGGMEFVLTDAEEAALLEECQARAGQDFAEEYAEQQDRKYEEWRERRWMGDDQ